MKVYSVTDVGRKRKVNQDYVFASETPVGNLPNLFVVADGMGGHNAGDFASSFAVETLVKAVAQDADYNPIKIMRHAIELANERLLQEASRDREMAGMGTTIVVLTIAGQYAYVANVGDSRLYVMEDKLCQVTRDHSLVQEMVQLGELRPEEARNHPDKNIITRALGARENVNIDFFDWKLEENSRILMCSDGLSNMLADEEIQEILSLEKDVGTKGKTLVAKANRNGGKDNIAVILIEPFTNEV
ncbi:MAG: Stp1/IreP family PP2C-type Ser/Thr phosphatase [Blautia sp.]|jgi:serine/threonine protein phosphatase PrpC